MRPVAEEHIVSQYFAQMPTQGVVGNIKAVGTVAYYVALYGNYQPHGHAGMDFACPIGTPIYAMADGKVLYAGWSEDLPGTGDVRKWLLYYNFGGIITVIQHDGWISITAHQSDNNLVSVGMQVKQGQMIGKSGNTKTRTTKVAPHVHVEALVDLTYKTAGGLIYGRTDPGKFFAGGLASQGTITPASEEEDMATPEQIWKHQLRLGGELFEAGDILVYARTNAEGAKNNAETAVFRAKEALAAAQAAPATAVQIMLGTRLEAPDGSGKSYTVADYLVFGWWYAMQAKDKPQGPPMDPAALTAAIQASATDVASRLEISVKETPNG